MPTKRMLSWSKRQSSSEPYYRTGGLLSIEPIEPDHNDYEAKTTLKVEKRRPANLTILPSNHEQHVCSPATSQYNAAVVGAATILHSVSNDTLRSPAPSTSTCSRSTSLQKPLPCRPRSASVPSIAELPAELPGSLLLENQGFPSSSNPVFARPTTQIFERESHPPGRHSSHESVSLDALDLVPAQLNHTRSVPELSSRYSIMKTVPSWDALQSTRIAQADLSTELDNGSLGQPGMPRRSRSDLITSLSSMHRKVSTKKGGMHGPSQMWLVQETKLRDRDAEKRRRCQNEASSATNPSTTRSKHIKELKATIAAQNQAISIFQSQFTSLASSHEARVASLVKSHSAEVTSFRNHIRALEEQISKQGLYHPSTNSPLFVLETTETPHVAIHDTTQIAGPASPSWFETESKQRSPQCPGASPEMENLKRKLGSTRRPETITRNLLPELNQYKQNNVALQQRIESLMAKLNESKKSERELRSILGMTEMKCAEFEDKAAHADKLARSVQALQNTIDHLESRLEIANTERIDAEEQLSNLRNDKSPFDLSTSKSQVPSSANQAALDASANTSTIFPGASPMTLELDSQWNSTLNATNAYVERLQDQLREKDSCIADLKKERKQLRQIHTQYERNRKSIAMHSDIQDGLSQEAHRTDMYIEQLRTAIHNRETIIEEKDRNILAVERQLEHHKLLLQAEMRRHAAMKLHVATEQEDSWPELTSLARQEDIDRWMDRLHERLRKEQSKKKGKDIVNTPDVQMESLRKEIDFYIREIILFKLDIKGYKSDIRKLKKITAQMEAYDRTSELEAEVCPLRQTATPVHSQFAPPTPELSSNASPIVDKIYTRTTTDAPAESSVTTLPSAPLRNMDYVAIVERNSRELDIPATLHNMAPKDDHAIEADRMDCGLSPHMTVPRSAECREPTVSVR